MLLHGFFDPLHSSGNLFIGRDWGQGRTRLWIHEYIPLRLMELQSAGRYWSQDDLPTVSPEIVLELDRVA